MKTSLSGILVLLLGVLATVPAFAAPVPYAGKIALNGLNVDGVRAFTFALRDQNGTVHWRNGADANASINVPVDRGHYLVLLGGQGMNPLPAGLFLDHPELYLQVHFFRPDTQQWLHLQPDQRITSSPHALAAEVAKLAESVKPGGVTKEMLAPGVLEDLNATIPSGAVTLSNLSPEVLAALQVTPSISTQPFARYDRNTGSAQIEVTGRGHDLSYQWLKNGQPVNGATAPVLEIAGAVLDDNATYAVRITNSLGQATSQAVTLQNAVGAPGPPLAEANATEVPRNGLVLWLDAKDVDADGIADNLPDGTQIQTWADKSGNDRNATQDSLVKRPYVDDSFGSDNPTLRFAGSQLLVIPDANVSVAEFYMVFSASGVNKQYMSLLTSSVGIKARIRIKGNRLNQYNMGINPTLNGTDRIGLEAYDQIHVLKLFPTSSSNTYFEDMILGAISETGGEVLTGSISEVILYDRRLDDNESTNLINHLKSKWSIQPSSEPNSADDLFLHWKFEPETDSYNGVFDHGGYFRHGDIVHMGQDRFVEGVDGKAFQFDGADDHINFGFSLNNVSTFSMWVNPELDPTTGEVPSMAMVVFGQGSATRRISWGGAGSATDGVLLGAYGNAENYQEVLTANAVGFKPGWNHLVVVIPDGQTFADIYLNGIKQPVLKTGYGFDKFNCGYGVIGFNTPHPHYHGAMDEVRLYSRAISEAEIQSLYNAVQTPILRSDGEHNATVGSAFSLSLAADNSPTTYLTEGLPAGLSLNVVTGQITGTLSQPGYHRVFVKAMNEHGTGSDVIAIVARPQTDENGWPVDVPDGSDLPQNGLVLWLDANDVDADGEFDSGTDHLKLANWADKAGKDHNATQATAFHQPTLRAGQIPERPALNLAVFDGNQSLAFPTINHCRTLFWVMNKGHGFDKFGSFIGKVGEVSDRWADMQADQYFYPHAQPSQIRNGLLRLGGLEVDITVGPEAQFEYRLQIACLRTSDVKAADLIGKQGHEDRYFTGNIGEMLIYDRALSENEIETVEKYLGQKWGIAITHDNTPPISGNPSTFTVTPANDSVTTAHLTEQILKYLKPEITTPPQPATVYADGTASFSVAAEGKYLTYQWRRNGADLPGETNATLSISDANATLHEGNYTVVVSNDFGNVESSEVMVDVNQTWPTDGLVGWWKFDETNGTVAYDSSGNDNHGTLVNGPTWTQGKVDGALNFDGTNDFVEVSGFSSPTTLTYSLWLKNEDVSFSPWTTLLEFGNDSPFFGLYNGAPGFAGGAIGTVPVAQNWLHVVASAEASTTKIFLQGSLNVTKTDSEFNKNGQGLGIGYRSGDSHFKGIIDDVRIYDRALSPAEVQALYQSAE